MGSHVVCIDKHYRAGSLRNEPGRP